MYRFAKRDVDHLAEAQELAAVQLANLIRHRSQILEKEAIAFEEATSFLAREILRLHREGERDAQRLANRAVSLLREHHQKRESALRIAGLSDQD